MRIYIYCGNYKNRPPKGHRRILCLLVEIHFSPKKPAAHSESVGRWLFVFRWWLLELYPAEVAVAFEVEGRDAVGGLCAAVAVDAGEGGIDAVLDAYALGEADLDAAEAAVDADDCTVAQVGIAQVEAREAEADVHVGPLERLAVVAVFLLAEGYVDLVQLAAVEDDGDGLFRDALTVAALLVVEKDERNTPHDGYEAEHILPDVVPRDDAAGGQKQQDADAAPDDGAGLVAVAEDVDEAGDDDEEGPPAVEADADDIE